VNITEYIINTIRTPLHLVWDWTSLFPDKNFRKSCFALTRNACAWNLKWYHVTFNSLGTTETNSNQLFYTINCLMHRCCGLNSHFRCRLSLIVKLNEYFGETKEIISYMYTIQNIHKIKYKQRKLINLFIN